MTAEMLKQINSRKSNRIKMSLTSTQKRPRTGRFTNPPGSFQLLDYETGIQANMNHHRSLSIATEKTG